MKIFIFLFFISSFLIVSCTEENNNSLCNKTGCKTGFYCDISTNQCNKYCTPKYCGEIGQKCNKVNGQCEPWCINNNDCDENYKCDNGSCELFYFVPEDKNLNTCIKDELKTPNNRKIWLSELESIKKLECPSKNISNISGIERIRNLESISFWENNITDISQLQNLKKLTTIQLGMNNITDISPLINLKNIKKLSLSDNNLEDISILRYLTSIKWLNLDNNNIKNINFFINLTNLKWLTIEHNPIIDANSTISKLEENGVSVYYKISNKKLFNKLNLTEKSLNNKNFNYKLFKIIRPENYIRITSDTSYDRLEKFILESPNQEDAGSCLYMANTGAMEIILNQVTDKEIKNDGETDISERYLMNADKYASSMINYTMTDLIKTFNYNNGALLNKDYPFTVGWVKKDSSGHRVASQEGVDGAEFTAEYNWINDLPDNWHDLLIRTPKVERTILFLDPNLNTNSIWNVGIIDNDVIERIKYELRAKNAPVIVIYNHYSIWHTVVIVGYDDNAGFDTECPMVKDTIKTFRKKGIDDYADKIEAHIQEEGGCNKKGIFFVRDSISDGDENTQTYYYGGVDFNDSYSRKIIYHSYDWVKYLGNHVYSIHRKK